MNLNRQTDHLSRKQINQQRYLKTISNILLVLLVIGSIYLIDQRPEIVSLEKAFLAVGVIGVSLYPSFQYLSDQNRPPMPFLPLVGLFYATSFGFPMFAGDVKLMTLFSVKSVDSISLFLVLLGLTGLISAFYYSKSFLWKRVVPLQLLNTYSLKSLLILLWIFLSLHLAFLYIPAIKDLPSVGQLLEPIGYIAYGMFFVIGKRDLLPKFQKFILIGLCLPMEILPRFASGLLSEVMILGLFMIIVAFFETKRIPIIIISSLIILLLIFSPIKAEFRQLTWLPGQNSPLNPIEKAQIFIDLSIKRFTSPPILKNENKNDPGNIVGRTAHIMLFSKVVEDTPKRVPYWQGETYLPLFTSFIPRFVFPGKPEERTGNDFGRRYNYLSSNDFTTSFNLPWIVEMYANFGEVGVILGMPLVGMLLSLLEQKFNHPGMQPLEFIIGATILFRLIYQEANFSLMVGNIFSLSLALFIIFKFFLGGKPKYSR
jgi:hypothetical protein